MLEKEILLQEFLSMFLCVIEFLIKLVLLYGVIPCPSKCRSRQCAIKVNYKTNFSEITSIYKYPHIEYPSLYKY